MADDQALHEKIGYIRGSLDSVKATVESVASDVKETNKTILDLAQRAVTQVECATRTKAVVDAVNSLQEDIEKKQTRETRAIQSPTPIIDPAVIADQVYTRIKRNGKDQSLVQRIKDHLGLVTTIGTIIGFLFIGGIKLAYFVVGIDQAVRDSEKITTRSTREIREDIQSLQKNVAEPKIVVISPDAGYSSPRRAIVRPRRNVP